MLSFFLVFAYFLAVEFMRDVQRIREYFIWLGMGTVGVMLITWVRHASWGFGAPYAPAMARPFFDDHTIFGATLTFLLALLVGLVKWEQGKGMNVLVRGNNKWFTLIILGLLIGLFLTFSRGAWLSLLLAAFVGWGIWRRWSWKISLSIIVILAGTAFLLKEPVSKWVNESRPQSLSAGWQAHILSSFNFVQHDSNLERLNRWKCAWRMFKSEPITGWGPATYSFQYGAFQKEEEMTRISTQNGDKGNAHSEYLGHLAEGGVLWGAAYVGLWIIGFWTGIRYIRRNKNKKNHLLATAILTALISYFIHGWVNGLLDQVEMAVWVFGAWAALIRLDVSTGLCKK